MAATEEKTDRVPSLAAMFLSDSMAVYSAYQRTAGGEASPELVELIGRVKAELDEMSAAIPAGGSAGEWSE